MTGTKIIIAIIKKNFQTNHTGILQNEDSFFKQYSKRQSAERQKLLSAFVSRAQSYQLCNAISFLNAGHRL